MSFVKLWENEPQPCCQCSLPDGASHDGGGSLGPLYLISDRRSLIGTDMVDILVACNACCSRLNLEKGDIVTWPPKEDPSDP